MSWTIVPIQPSTDSPTSGGVGVGTAVGMGVGTGVGAGVGGGIGTGGASPTTSIRFTSMHEQQASRTPHSTCPHTRMGVPVSRRPSNWAASVGSGLSMPYRTGKSPARTK